jgi:hypothetical protein
VRADSQDVGLEAAIIERVRKSSLVECACIDNVSRLSGAPKLWILRRTCGCGAGW